MHFHVYRRFRSGDESTGHISDALLRALNRKGLIDQQLQAAGLQTNIFLSGLSEKKQAATRKGLNIYKGDGYSVGGRRVAYKGGSYLCEAAAAVAGDEGRRHHLAWPRLGALDDWALHSTLV
jgi:hypothetical protein